MGRESSERVVECCYDAAAARCASDSASASLGAGIADDTNCGYCRASTVACANCGMVLQRILQDASSRVTLSLLT